RLVITGTTSGSQLPFRLGLLQSRPLTLMGSGARSRRSFAAMMHMVHHGGLRGVVGQTFDLAEAARAHEVMAGRDFFGKLVLRVPQPARNKGPGGPPPPLPRPHTPPGRRRHPPGSRGAPG